jgi:5-formyltetrahydrofolate cyclo-ligase
LNKVEIRKLIYSKREAQTSEECRLRSRAIQTRLFNKEEFRRSKTVHFYINLTDEVETREMIGRAFEMGKRVVVPYLKEELDEIGISEIKDMKRDIQKNRFGFEEPFGPYLRPIDPSNVELWIVPGVAFDLTGNRIGYGKGYYDRLLRFPGKKILVGLAFDFQLVESIPNEGHDVKMNWIVTEYRTIQAF